MQTEIEHWHGILAVPRSAAEGNVHTPRNAAELDHLLKTTSRVLVNFQSGWCEPSLEIAPYFAAAADRHTVPGGLAFAKVDVGVSRTRDIASRYGITETPTFVVFQGGKASPVQLDKDSGPSIGRITGSDQLSSLWDVVDALYRKASLDTAIAKRQGYYPKSPSLSGNPKSPSSNPKFPSIKPKFLASRNSGYYEPKSPQVSGLVGNKSYSTDELHPTWTRMYDSAGNHVPWDEVSDFIDDGYESAKL